MCWEQSDSRKLAEAYIALALAKDVTREYLSEQSGDLVLERVLNMLDITTKLLEEVLDDALPVESDLPEHLSECLPADFVM